MQPLIALINVTPDPVAVHLGPIPLLWYGIAYAVGLAATYLVVTREAQRRGLDARLVDTGIVVVAVAALLGGRLYHVIDQWQRYKDDLLTVFLPIARTADGGYQFAGFTGLGVYGGIITGTIAAWLFIRFRRQPFWRWADVVAPGLFVMQAVGRWGNFFNQELYGPPTTLPWGITIDCAHRVVDYPCTTFPVATTGFHPLFLYESVSGIVGAFTLLWIARRFGPRMRPGDLLLLWAMWYAVVRFALETLRSQNWTLGGIPTAMIVSTVVFVIAGGILLWRHRPGAAGGDRWGEPPERVADADIVEEIEVDDEDPALEGRAPAAVDATDADDGSTRGEDVETDEGAESDRGRPGGA